MAWNDITFTAGQTDYIAMLNELRSLSSGVSDEVVSARDGELTLLANIDLRLTQAQVDARIGALAPLLSGMTADLNAGGFKVTNLADPTAPQDAATQSWVASQIIAGGSPGDVPITSLDKGTATEGQLYLAGAVNPTSFTLPEGSLLIGGATSPTAVSYPVEATVISAAHTAAAGEWLAVDTSGGAVTITMPTGTDGDVIRFTDFAGTWATNNVTLTGGNFLDVEGVVQAADFVLDLNNFDVTAVFHTGAWRIR